MKRILTLLLVAGLYLGYTVPAQASYLSGLIAPGTNTLSDDSIETYFDVNGNNKFDTGDVIAGVVRFQAFGNANTNVLTGTHVYAVFSQQVAGFTTGTLGGQVAVFTTTTAPNLTLNALTGNAALAGQVFGVFSNQAGYANDVLTTAGATAVGGGAGSNNISKLQTYVANNGQLEFTTAFVQPTDFFQATVQPAGVPLLTNLKTTLANSTPSQQFATPVFALSDIPGLGAISTVIEPNGVTVTSPAPVPGTVTSAVSLSQAGASGGKNNAFVQLGLFSGSGGNPALASAAGGGIDNGTFTFSVVPEPTSLVLFGVGFAGFAGARLVRRKKSV